MKPDRKKGQSKLPREVHPPTRSRADDPEPSVASGHLPMWVFIILALGLFWGMMYLDKNAGGFNPRVYQRFASSNQLVSLVPFDPVRDAMNRGFAIYSSSCMPCHQPNGQGTPGLFPPLAESEWVTEGDPARLIRIAYNGVSGPIMVKGQQWNLLMPGVGRDANLSNEQLAHLLTYIRMSWGNNAPPVTPDQVEAVRKEIGGRSSAWTAAELEQISLKQ
jgi:mono/diheme cytochrome c family protein